MNAAFDHNREASLAQTPAHSQTGKGERRTLERIVGICLAIGLIPLPASAHLTAKQLSKPAGHYCGKLLSGGDLVDVETSLQVDRRGHISGTYRFDDDGNTTTGTLSEIGASQGGVRTLRWFDRYGMGLLTIRFTSDYRHFDGLWGPQDADPSYTWNGDDCDAPTS